MHGHISDENTYIEPFTKNLRISYNDVMPFFVYGNNQINIDSIEGNAIETFIDKHNLTTDWKNENFKWGNKDENGTFDGVIGRVIYKLFINDSIGYQNYNCDD